MGQPLIRGESGAPFNGGGQRLVSILPWDRDCLGPRGSQQPQTPMESELGEVWGKQDQDQALRLVRRSVTWHFHPKSRLSGDLENTAEMENGRNRVSPFILLSRQQCVVGKKKYEEVVNGRINNNIRPPHPSSLSLCRPFRRLTINKVI